MYNENKKFNIKLYKLVTTISTYKSVARPTLVPFQLCALQLSANGPW